MVTRTALAAMATVAIHLPRIEYRIELYLLRLYVRPSLAA
jgi:hypothetical protein